MTTKKRCRIPMALGLGLATLAAGRPARAEDAKAVAPGSRVRVTTSDHRFVGRLAALRGETIILEREKGETLEIHRAEVLGLEVSQRRGRKLKGAAIGLLVGLGAAAAIGVAGSDDCSGRSSGSLCFGPAEVTAISGILTVPVGALLGALIAPGEKWRPAGVADLSVQAGPSRGGGFGVRVAVGF
jgi:hypothetical protein